MTEGSETTTLLDASEENVAEAGLLLSRLLLNTGDGALETELLLDVVADRAPTTELEVDADAGAATVALLPVELALNTVETDADGARDDDTRDNRPRPACDDEEVVLWLELLLDTNETAATFAGLPAALLLDDAEAKGI